MSVLALLAVLLPTVLEKPARVEVMSGFAPPSRGCLTARKLRPAGVSQAAASALACSLPCAPKSCAPAAFFPPPNRVIEDVESSGSDTRPSEERGDGSDNLYTGR